MIVLRFGEFLSLPHLHIIYVCVILETFRLISLISSYSTSTTENLIEND